MKVSVELLYHFECEVCRKWWSVGDFTWPQTSAKHFVFCPHCGTRQALPENPLLAEDFQASGED